MSAIEIPNSFVAAGVFANPNSFAPFPTPILSSAGIEPYDPDNAADDIKGGVTRLTTGVYIVRMVEAIDFLEGVAIGLPGANNTASAIILPTNATPGEDDSKAIAVNSFNRTDGTGLDGPFNLLVFRFASGPRYADIAP